MSVRTDSGVCRYCGNVLEVERLRELDVPSAVDAYSCEDCVDAAQEAGLLG